MYNLFKTPQNKSYELPYTSPDSLNDPMDEWKEEYVNKSPYSDEESVRMFFRAMMMAMRHLTLKPIDGKNVSVAAGPGAGGAGGAGGVEGD